MRVCVILFIALLACRASAVEWQNKFDVIAYYEPITLYDFLNDWNQENYVGGSYAWHYVHLESGLIVGKWRYGFQAADISIMQFSEDTAELQMRLKNKLPLKTEPYEISLDFERVRYVGMDFSRVMRPDNQMKAEFTFSLLNGLLINSGTIKGTVVPNSPNDYDFGSLYVDYHYNNEPLFNEPEQEAQGYGFSLSASLDWQISPRLFFQAEAINIYGFLYWPDAPFVDALVVTDTKTYDENGYAHVEPAIEGQTGRHALNTTLPYIVNLKSRLDLSDHFYLTFAYLHTKHVAYFSNGLGVNLKVVRLDYQRTNALVAHQIKLHRKGLSVYVMADELDPKKLHNLGLGFEFSLSL